MASTITVERTRRRFSGRWVAIAAGVVALLTFFFPWIEYEERTYSGFAFARALGGVTGAGFDVTLYAIPVLAIIVIAFAGVSLWSDSEGGTIFNYWVVLAAVSGFLLSTVFLADKAVSGDKALEALKAGARTGFGPGIYTSIIMFAIAAIGGIIDWRRPAVSRLRSSWRTQDYVLLANIAIVFGVIYWQWIQAWVWAAVLTFGIGAQVGQELFFGVWLVAGLLGGYIVRRPGAAFLAESLAALAEVLLGAPAGPILVVTGIMQAVGCELVFALTGYRRWGWGTMLGAGVITALIAIPWNWFRLGYFGLDGNLLLILLGVRIVSGGLAATAAKLIGDALARMDVLNAYPIGRERMQEV